MKALGWACGVLLVTIITILNLSDLLGLTLPWRLGLSAACVFSFVGTIAFVKYLGREDDDR